MSQTDKIVKALERTAERVVAKISLDITANLTAAAAEGGTPVDTGWASANWVPVIGAASKVTAGGPSRDSKGRFKGKGSRRDSGEIAAARGAQLAGEAKLITYKLSQGTVFISNNVPYIGILNNGSSQQAPKAFIERAIEKALKVDLLGLGR